MFFNHPPTTIPSASDHNAEESSSSVEQSAASARPQIPITTILPPIASSTDTGVNRLRPHVQPPLLQTALDAYDQSPNSLSASSPSPTSSPSDLDHLSSSQSTILGTSIISPEYALYLISTFPSDHPVCFTKMPPGQDGKVVDLEKSRCAICCEIHVYLSRLLSIETEDDKPFTICNDCQEKEAQKSAMKGAARSTTKQESDEQRGTAAKRGTASEVGEVREPIVSPATSSKGPEETILNDNLHKPGGKDDPTYEMVEQYPVPHNATAEGGETRKGTVSHEPDTSMTIVSKEADLDSFQDRHVPGAHAPTAHIHYVGEPVMTSEPHSTVQDAATKNDEESKGDKKHKLITNAAGSSDGTGSSLRGPRPHRVGEPVLGMASKSPPAPPESSLSNSKDTSRYNPRRNTLEYPVLPRDYFIGHHLARHLADPKQSPVRPRPAIKLHKQPTVQFTEEPSSPLSPTNSSSETMPPTNDSADNDEPPRGRTLEIRGSQHRSFGLKTRYRLRQINSRILGHSPPHSPNPPAVREDLVPDEHKALAKILMLPKDDGTPSPPRDTSDYLGPTSKADAATKNESQDAAKAPRSEHSASHESDAKPKVPRRKTTIVTFAPDPEILNSSLSRVMTARPDGGDASGPGTLREPEPGQILGRHSRAPSLDQVLVAGSSRRASLLQYVLTMDTYASEFGSAREEGGGEGVAVGRPEGGGERNGDDDEYGDNEGAASDFEKRFPGHRDTFKRFKFSAPKDEAGVGKEEEGEGEDD